MKKFFVCAAIFAAMVFMVSCGGSDSGNDNNEQGGNGGSQLCHYGEYKCDSGNSYFCGYMDGSNDLNWKFYEQCANSCDSVTGKCNDGGNNGGNNGGNDGGNNGGNDGGNNGGNDGGNNGGNDGGNNGGNNGGNDGGNNGGNDGGNNGDGDDDCADGLFYYQDECQSPWGKMWTVTFEEAQVSETKDDGTAWDVPGGLPDLFACLYINDEEKFCTSVVDDKTKAEWNEDTTVSFSAKTDKIEYCLFDEDLAEHDLIGCAEHEFDWFTYEDGIEISGGVVDHFWITLTPAW